MSILAQRFSRAFAAAREVERYAQEFDPKKHPKDAKGKWARKATHQDIRSLVADTVTKHRPATGQKPQWTAYRTVDPAEAKRLRQATGMDFAGYHHSIDDSAILHMLHEHGPGGVAITADEEPLAPGDFERIPEVVAAPDEVKSAGLTRLGLPAIRYKRRINGLIFYVEEVRTGKRQLAAKSLWKIRSRPKK